MFSFWSGAKTEPPGPAAIEDVVEVAAADTSNGAGTDGGNEARGGEDVIVVEGANNSSKQQIQVGTRLAVYWPLDKEYYKATVLELAPPTKVHLVYDDDGVTEWISLAQEKYQILSSERNEKSSDAVDRKTDPSMNGASTKEGISIITPEDKGSPVQKDTTPEQELPSKRRRKKIDKEFFTSDHAEACPPRPKRKKKEKRAVEDEFDQVWICVECKEAECMMKPEAQELLICEGPCLRAFHYPCAGLSQLPAEDEQFVCTDCTNRKHICAICQNYGLDDEDVFKCNKKECGLFFHESCLSMRNVEVEMVPVDDTKKSPDKSDEGSGSSMNQRPRFLCPAHNCWTCEQNDMKEQERQAAENETKQLTKKDSKAKKKKVQSVLQSKKGTLYRCLECPISFHLSCIPPTSKFHELAILCPEHSETCKLPQLDVESSFQGKIEKSIDSKFYKTLEERERIRRTRKSGDNPFFPGVKGDKPTKRDEVLLEKLQEEEDSAADNLWFCLPCDFKEEVHSKPPNYRHVHMNQYDPSNKPPLVPTSGDVCNCVGFCGDDCLNRMEYAECYGKVPADASTNGVGKRRSSNCKVGPGCGNRQMGLRNFAKCQPKREKGKGWGLVTLEKVHKGSIVIEYAGEIIDEKTKEQRLIEWSRDHPNDHNFYIMALQPGWFIDARHVANLSRFINHSCQPNCVNVAINVGGRMRCGIKALRDIEAGEFLSYDYHFDTRHGDQFVCRCGAPNCRGTMKQVGNKGAEAAKKSSKELWEDAKAGYERDRKFLEDCFKEEEERRSQVSAAVPGADSGAKSQAELVANGVQPKHREDALSNRLFLWRNAQEGSDFASRFARLDQKKRAGV